MAARPTTFQKTVAAAATPESLVASALLVAVAVVQALSTNTGSVVLGDSNVTTNRGITLAAPAAGTTPDSVTIRSQKGDNEIDLVKWFCKVAVNGEGVAVTYIEK